MLTPSKGELRKIVNQIVAKNELIVKLQRDIEELYAKLDAYDAYDATPSKVFPSKVFPSKVFPPGYRGDGV